MKGKITGIIIGTSIGVVLILGFFSSKNISLAKKIDLGLDKYWNEKVIIKDLYDYKLNHKDYKIVLSVNEKNEDYKYLNVYEKRLGGVYYECNKASEQGGSKSKIGFSVVENEEETFTVMYGQNKENYIKNCMINLYDKKLDDIKTEEVNLLEEDEYFIKILNGKFCGIEGVQSVDGEDQNGYFLD